LTSVSELEWDNANATEPFPTVEIEPMTCSSVYKLSLPVPVEWLDEIGQPNLETSLTAGTMLDLAPFVVSDGLPSEQSPARIRVNGREGIARVSRLREALPGWRRELRRR
jgi:hypothetical protein